MATVNKLLENMMFANLFGSLAFIGAFFGLVGLAMAVIVALLTRHFRAAWRIGWLMLAWAGVYIAVLLLASFTSSPRRLDLGQEHCFDEMCFSVQSVTTTKTLGTGSNQITANGVYYLVTVQLRNAALRQPQKPSQPAVWVIDAQGRKYTEAVSTAEEQGPPFGQSVAFPQLWNQRLQPGETQAHILAFDLPADVSQPALVITEGGGPTYLIIGDENSFFHSKTEFRLAG